MSLLNVSKVDLNEVLNDIVRVPNQNMRDRYGEIIPAGSVCKITANSKSIYAIIRTHLYASGAEIQIDERLRNQLNLDADKKYDFEFQWQGIIGEFKWAWNSSDPAYRTAARLGVLSVLLGSLGLI